MRPTGKRRGPTEEVRQFPSQVGADGAAIRPRPRRQRRQPAVRIMLHVTQIVSFLLASERAGLLSSFKFVTFKVLQVAGDS